MNSFSRPEKLFAIFGILIIGTPSLAGITYAYEGPPLIGSSPYHGTSIEGTVVFRSADVLALLGTGGSLQGDSVNDNDDFVESFSFTVGGLTFDSSNSTYDFFIFTFSPTLEITQWEANAEADHGRGSSLPEMVYARNPGDLAGDDDSYPDKGDFQLEGAFAFRTFSGSWTQVAVPEASSGILALLGAAALVGLGRQACRRNRIACR